MIEIHITKNSLTVKGHAGYAERGKDIVCASASTLVQTFIKSTEDLTENKIEYGIWPGMVEIKYENPSEKMKILIDSFFVGICMLANEYPQHVRVI